MVPLLDGIGPLAAEHDGFILDLWGVLHDGHEPYPGAIDCLERLRAAGKRVVLLSNAPRRAEAVVEQLGALGIGRRLYDHVMTSGEDAWRHLARNDDPWYAALGRRIYLLGVQAHDGMVTGIGRERVPGVAEADFILNTGIAYHETLDDHRALLEAAARRRLPMICANPDLTVVHRGQHIVCAGALAQAYEALGGEVRWHGKPHPGVYDTCFELLGGLERARVLAVGDSLRTDMAGAAQAGVPALFVTGGIHADALGIRHGERPDTGRLAALFRDAGLTPKAAVPAFVW